MKTINRRQFIASMLAAGIAPRLSAMPMSSTATEFFVSARGKNGSQFGVSSINDKNKNTQTVLTDFRGHGLAQNPVKKQSVVVFARRPGTTGIEINLLTGTQSNIFQLAKNRNLQGHGCFSADGNLLFTAEADSKTGAGKIAIRETQNYQLLSEMDSYGIGPHEIKLLPNVKKLAKTLVVANGGIHTRPETGRKKLNLPSMHSSLTYIDLSSGNKLDSFQVSEEKASIRHLDVAADGTVALAMQVQREATNHQNIVALSAIHKPGKAIQLFEKPDRVIARMDDYMGSVAINSQSRIAGFTSPKGNLVAFWNIDSGEFSGYHRFSDVCGVCVSQNQKRFIVSNSLGEIRQLDALTLQENKTARLRFSDTHWDNHMISAFI